MKDNEDIIELLDLIRQLDIRFGSYYIQILSKYKLTLQHCTLLFLLMHENRLNMKTIAKHLSVTNPAITHFADQLESKGLVKRIPSNNDRRIILLEITDKGKQCVQKIQEKAYGFVSQIFSEFDEYTRKQIIIFYRTMLTRFDGVIAHETN